MWVAWCLAHDLNSPRVADVVDGWRGWLDVLSFVRHDKNVLTDLFDPEAPGIGAAVMFFDGLPLFHANLVALSFRAVQVLQIFWVAVTALGIGLLASRRMTGIAAPSVAVAAFLFAPFTRLTSIFPMVFMLGPLYSTALALCAVAVWRWRSNAALAALGAVAGVASTYPSVVPVVALVGVVTLWILRASWRELSTGLVVGTAAFAAVVIPALPNVLTPARMLNVHVRWDGVIQLIDPALLGQLPVRSFTQFPPGFVSRPLDVALAALLVPFAHPRMAVRLVGDVIFDPVATVLLAVGVAVCLRSVTSSSAARILLLFAVAALVPAAVSPVNVVDVIHAVALPVPLALLAATGFVAVHRCARVRRRLAAVATGSPIAAGGVWLFDVVNPRILAASSLGLMFRSVDVDDASRVVFIDYPRDFGAEVRKGFFTGPITYFGARRPFGYLQYDEEDGLPADDLAAEGKNILFWSWGIEKDPRVSAAVCARWPAATLFEIWDDAHLGRAMAADIAGGGWSPQVPADRWTRRSWNRRARDPPIGTAACGSRHVSVATPSRPPERTRAAVFLVDSPRGRALVSSAAGRPQHSLSIRCCGGMGDARFRPASL